MKIAADQPRKRRYIPEEQRQKDILKAAIEVFSEKGYHKAKMQEIASRAGVAHGTVYRYYPSKFALATEIIGAKGATGFIESLKENAFEELNPEEFFKVVAQKYFGDLKERLPLMRFRIAEALSHSDLARQYYLNLLHRFIQHLSEFVAEYQKKGLFKQGNPYLVGHIFYSMLFGFLYCQELMLGKEVTHIELDEVVNSVVDLFLRGVENHS